MPRANRYFVPGYAWHITQRCHKQEFLLKFARDRARWIHWLFEARKRYGLCVLNYAVTSNHIHLLVQDTGENIIPRSLQLIAGRTGQEYNKRKGRKGAFWEDRYHATAVEANEHLFKCLVYIDLNMVRAGVVRHPVEWPHGGYREIQDKPKRYRIIDNAALMRLCGVSSITTFQALYRGWVDEALLEGQSRAGRWTESIAVGSQSFIEEVKAALGVKASHRELIDLDEDCLLREDAGFYNGYFYEEMENISENIAHFDDV